MEEIAGEPFQAVCAQAVFEDVEVFGLEIARVFSAFVEVGVGA
jgi:hypothetical protein